MSDKEKELVNVYETVGLSKGDTVFVHANLLAFGLVATDKKKFVEYFLNPLLDVVGDSGTVVVLAYTFSYATGKAPFHLETSPSEAGMFTEHIRTLPGALRSFHPLCSVVAYGKNSKVITNVSSRSAFGWGSPFFVLHELKAKCLYLGMTAGQSCTFLHYVEQMYGVSHCYNKAFFHPAYKNGELVTGPFMAFLRNRSAEAYDFTRFENEMKTRGLLAERAHNGGVVQCLNFTDAFKVGMAMLEKDTSAFLKAPFYVTE